MLGIDGLITGLDTSSIIEGLLSIQQRKVDSLNIRRGEVLQKQTSFAGIEARLQSLRSSLGKLASHQNSSLRDKIVSSSDEDAITAAASDDAVNGTYRLRVNQLASAHQVATAGFSSLEDKVGTGRISIGTGDLNSVSIEITEDNNSIQGVVDAINASDADVTASIVNDGTGDTPYRVLLTSDKTGEANEIRFDNELSGGLPLSFDFDNPVEEARNSIVQFGSGAGAITVENETNKVNGLIEGVTLDLRRADVDSQITLNIEQDVEKGVDAVSSFVDSYNEFIGFVNDQVRFNPETEIGGPLLGERAVSTIQNDIQFALTGIVGGLTTEMNRLTSAGISVEDDGKISLDRSRLEDVLAGRVEDVSADDAARLFSLSGASDRTGLSFVIGSANTVEGNFEIDITAPATSATTTATNGANSITIDSSNNTFQLVVDGQTSSLLTLEDGTYTPEEMAAHLESVINGDSSLNGRTVDVGVEAGAPSKLTITSDSLGGNSEVKLQSGSAWQELGFAGDETGSGTDVEGHFIVNGVIEEAEGRGTLLVGNKDNDHTADLQIRVSLGAADVADGSEGSITVTRGLASRLDKLIDDLVDVTDGKLKSIKDRFTATDESIQQSIERVNAQVESQQQSLVAQFTALERIVGGLQQTGNFLSAQFAGTSGLRI